MVLFIEVGTSLLIRVTVRKINYSPRRHEEHEEELEVNKFFNGSLRVLRVLRAFVVIAFDLSIIEPFQLNLEI